VVDVIEEDQEKDERRTGQDCLHMTDAEEGALRGRLTLLQDDYDKGNVL